MNGEAHDRVEEFIDGECRPSVGQVITNRTVLSRPKSPEIHALRKSLLDGRVLGLARPATPSRDGGEASPSRAAEVKKPTAARQAGPRRGGSVSTAVPGVRKSAGADRRTRVETMGMEVSRYCPRRDARVLPEMPTGSSASGCVSACSTSASL